jgi:hypothetical protein
MLQRTKKLLPFVGFGADVTSVIGRSGTRAHARDYE